jgi:hypothetical protein
VLSEDSKENSQGGFRPKRDATTKYRENLYLNSPTQQGENCGTSKRGADTSRRGVDTPRRGVDTPRRGGQKLHNCSSFEASGIKIGGGTLTPYQKWDKDAGVDNMPLYDYLNSETKFAPKPPKFQKRLDQAVEEYRTKTRNHRATHADGFAFADQAKPVTVKKTERFKLADLRNTNYQRAMTHRFDKNIKKLDIIVRKGDMGLKKTQSNLQFLGSHVEHSKKVKFFH